MHRQRQLAQAHGLQVKYRDVPRILQVEGVGHGVNEARQIADVPIAVLDELGEFQTPVVENSSLPALWGIESQHRRRVVIDTGGECCIFPGPAGFKMVLSPGSKVAKMERAISGHMMLPCSDFSRVGQEATEQKQVRKQWILYSGGPSSSFSSTQSTQE